MGDVLKASQLLRGDAVNIWNTHSTLLCSWVGKGISVLGDEDDQVVAGKETLGGFPSS